MQEASLVAVTLLVAQFERHVHVVQAERMAKRDQFARPLGGLNSGDLGDRQDIALGNAVIADQVASGRAQGDRSRGTSQAALRGLTSDVHHLGATLCIKMG